MALFMDRALHRSLEAEDAMVLETRFRDFGPHQFRQPGPRELTGPRPEQVAWAWLGLDGAARQSPDFPPLAAAELPLDRAVEWNAGGRHLLIKAVAKPGGRLVLALDRTHEEALVADFRRTLLIAVASSAVLAALLGRYLAARGLAPLHALAEEAGALRPGSLERRLDGARYPVELGEVVERLNGALERMEEAFDRLSGLAGELAHELRTPIQTLRAEAEALVRSGQGPPEALGSILEECDRLAAQVEQMLFLARAEDPGAELQRVPIGVAALLEEVRAFFEGSAEEAGISLVAGCPEGLVLQGDVGLLRRALHNLTSNALRHAPAGGTVRLGAQVSEGRVALEVSDTGPGIPPGLRSVLGQRWAKGKGSRGLGLGLAIVRSIARLHGGELALESSEPGGTLARLEFPWIDPKINKS
jgi:two-component system heavy metal sensor histidine kinase CusS